MVMGAGNNISFDHIVKFGKIAKIDKPKIHLIIDQTRQALSRWQELAKNYGVSPKNNNHIKNKLDYISSLL